MLPTEADGHWQRDRARRYFGAPALRAERNTRLKRWRRALQGAGERAAAAELGLGPEGGGTAALGLLSLRKAPGQQQHPAAARAGGRALDLPSLSYLPLKVEEERPAPQQQPVAWPAGVSAAAELAAEQAAAAAAGESLEEQLLRRTREFNRATRERPHDVQLWLRFARFQVGKVGWGGVGVCCWLAPGQLEGVASRRPSLPHAPHPLQDEALRLGPPQRGAARAAAEKKISILERALSLHPGSDELLLALLRAVGAAAGGWGIAGGWRWAVAGSWSLSCERAGHVCFFLAPAAPDHPPAPITHPRRPQAETVCEEKELERRWRAVLAKHSGSPRLWRAYLHQRWVDGCVGL